ncbi:MAG: hypothetical protein K2X04_05635, partial [Burkholderiales bacterium]|nr:hypothetical protein [Burkholderiales bacterium]
ALVSAHGLTYSASIARSGNLTWSATKGKVDLSITNNGGDIESTIWELKNTLAPDEGLSAKNVNVSLNSSTINGLNLTPIDSANCPLINAIIAGNSFCQYKVSYGAVGLVLNQTEVGLKAAYNFYAGTQETNIAKFTVAATSRLQPRIEVQVKMNPTGGAMVIGSGTQTVPWEFTAYSNKFIGLQYTFKNDGDADADQFNIDVGNLANGAALKNTTCPIGIKTSAFKIGTDCVVNVDVPDFELFNIPNLVNGKLNTAILKLDLPYSYKYGGTVYHGQSEPKHVSFKRLWTSVIHTIDATSSTESAYEFEVKSQVAKVADSQSYPITVTPTLTQQIAGVRLTGCTIADQARDSCTSKISLPKNMFIAGKKLLVTFKTSANALGDSNAIISGYEVGSTVIVIHNELELATEIQGDTSGKVFALGNDINLIKEWIPVDELKNATVEGQGYKITGLSIDNKTKKATGMFRLFSNNVTIRDLNLEGVVTSNETDSVGLLVGSIKGSNIRILNSNFNSKVSAINNTGGVIGEFANNISTNIDLLIESVTVISNVSASNWVGGLIGYAKGSIKWKNIRITSELKSKERTGGLAGSLYDSNSYIAENIIANTKITVDKDGSQIGGIFPASRGIKMSNIDATVDIIGGNATVVGGIVGFLSWEADSDKMSDVIVRGTISTLVDPRVASRRISGIGSALTRAGVSKVVDMTTIAYYNGATTANYISPLTATTLTNYFNSDNVYYARPATATYINAVNPTFVLPLIGNTAVEQESSLVDKGFDFANTWTIKKINGVDSIGIKEDSIPQFPKW